MEKFEIRCILSGKETNGKVAVFEEIVAPGSGPPRHIHPKQIEVFHIIDGLLRFEVDGETFQRGTGAAASVPAGAVHTFRNEGDKPVIIHFELIPAGKSEEFFEKLVAGDYDQEKVEAFFKRYGLELAGPPLEEKKKRKK